MKKEMWYVANITLYEDIEQPFVHSQMTVAFEEKEKALSRIPRDNPIRITKENGKIRYSIEEEDTGWELITGRFVEMAPVSEAVSIDPRDIEKWVTLYSVEVEDEVKTMKKELEEIEKTLADEALFEEEVPYATGIIRDLARRHRKKGKKAKRHLSKIYPIQKENVAPIRKTRNGGYVHEGDTYKWDEKHYKNKLSRLEGKRLCREWEPEEPETVCVPEDENILTRIADLEEELHWNMMELSAAQEEVDYYLAECLAISNEIERLRKLL